MKLKRWFKNQINRSDITVLSCSKQKSASNFMFFLPSSCRKHHQLKQKIKRSLVEYLYFHSLSKYHGNVSFEYLNVAARTSHCMTCLSNSTYYNINYVSLFLDYFVSKQHSRHIKKMAAAFFTENHSKAACNALNWPTIYFLRPKNKSVILGQKKVIE